MPMSDFDRQIEALSAPEAKQERLAREAAERKRRQTGPPDTNPVPLADRDQRELVSDNGIRVYRQPAGDDEYRRKLEAAHFAWARVGSPENGAVAEHLIQTLAECYLAADPDSGFEAEVVT